MDIYGIAQILLFFGLIVACTKPLGLYMARVFAGERTFLSPVFAPVERLCYRLFGVRPDEDMPWTVYGFAMLMFSVVGIVLTYVLLRAQGSALPVMESAPLQRQRHDARPGVQHRELVRDEHQLAELLAGNDDFLLLEHGLARGPQLDVGGDGYRGSDRDRSWLRASAGKRHRQLLGRRHPSDALHSAADQPDLRDLSGSTRRPAELQRLYDRDDDRRRADAGHRAGTGRLAGSDQDAGDERRRLLQRQLRAPLRKPDAADELHPDLLDLPDSRRADVHVRQDGRQYPAGLGAVRRDEYHVLHRAFRLLRLRGGGQSARPRTARSRREYGGQGNALRYRRLDTLRDGHDRRLLRRGQRDARFVHADRRSGSHREHHDRRVDLRRCRRGAVRDADVCGTRGLHRRI